jgi:hypothetical protein
MNHPFRRYPLPLLATLLLCTGLPLTALAETVASVASPGKVLQLELDLSKEGRISYRVQRNGKPVITDSLLGLRLRDGAQLFPWFELQGKEESAFDETWEQPWGESRSVRNHYNEVRAHFAVRVQQGIGREQVRFEPRLRAGRLDHADPDAARAQLVIERLRVALLRFPHAPAQVASSCANARDTAANANAAVTWVAAPSPPPQSSLSESALAGRVPQTVPSACG